jgi:hypothetical protein
MAILREINHLKPGEHFTPFIKLEGGFGGDFALKVFRQTWFDNNGYRISCAALDPSGGETSLIAHFDFKMGGLVDASGALIDAYLPDTVAFVVMNYKEWRNKAAIITILSRYWGIADQFGEFAGVKPLDFVWRNPQAKPKDIETGCVEAKVTWDDFEFILVFDLPNAMITFREIDRRYRIPLLTYLCSPSNTPPREEGGVLKPPKQVINETIEAILAGLMALKPTYAASKRSALFRAQNTSRRAKIVFRADRNNKAGVYIAMGMDVFFEGGAVGEPVPAMPEELAWRARNISWYWYELSRYRQRAIVISNITALLLAWLGPWLSSVDENGQ